MIQMRLSIFVILSCLLCISCVFGESIQLKALTSLQSEGQSKAIATGPLALTVAPTFFCASTNPLLRINFTWSPFNSLSTATLSFLGQNGHLFSVTVSDTGFYQFPQAKLPATYYRVTIANEFGNAISKLASINCMGNVTSPNASFVISTATTSFPVVWQPGKFSVQSASTLNISFVDQVTQLNYTISNVPNAPGNATVNIAALGLPPSTYVVYVIGLGFE